MKVLIVGGDGYIGSVLVSRLQHKHQLTVYDLLRLQDIRDNDLLGSFCKGKEALIHLAGITNNDECEKNRKFSESINLNAFFRVVVAADRAGIKRLIFASSVAAYGSSSEELEENSPLLPTTAYGRDKANCEAFLQGYCHVPYIITRSATACGYSPRMRNDLTINKMVHDALNQHVIKVNGGKQIRCHIHMLNLCAFYELLLEAPLEKVQNQAFNVVAKNESVGETAHTVASLISMTRVEFGPPTDDRSYSVSGKKAKEVLGWKPKRSYAEAVEDLLIAHKAGGYA